MREFHESHDGHRDPGDQAGRRHRPVRRRDRRRRRSHPGLPGEARPGRSALRPRQLPHLHVPRRDLRLLPRAGDQQGGRARRPARLRRLGDGRLPGACSRATCPSTRTRSTPTGTTSATSRSCAQGNLDALHGAVEVEPGRAEVADGSARRPRWTRAEVEGPVLVGSGCRDRRRRPDRRARRSSATAAGSAPGPGCATRSCLAGAELPPRGDADRRIAASRRRSPDAFLTALRATRAPRPRTIGAWSLFSVVAAALVAAALRRLRARLPARVPSLCTRCGRRLADAEPLHGSGPPGLDRAWSSAAHEGVARDLVAALKFRRLLPVADLMADRIQWLAPARLLSGTIVPVPTARLRSLAARLRPRRRARRGARRARRSAARALPRAPRRRPPGRQAAGRADRPPAARSSCAARRRAASCSSTTFSPPARRSPPAPRRCVRRRRPGRRDHLRPAPLGA